MSVMVEVVRIAEVAAGIAEVAAEIVEIVGEEVVEMAAEAVRVESEAEVAEVERIAADEADARKGRGSAPRWLYLLESSIEECERIATTVPNTVALLHILRSIVRVEEDAQRVAAERANEEMLLAELDAEPIAAASSESERANNEPEANRSRSRSSANDEPEANRSRSRSRRPKLRRIHRRS